MLTEMTIHIYASEAATYFATSLVDSGDTDYSIEAAICKVFVTELGWETINRYANPWW